MKALIVDDSAVMRKVVERALRQAGLEFTEIVEAGNGVEALEALRALEAAGTKLSVILTDIHMPVMDGLCFAEAVRRENLAPGVPVIMITTEGAEDHVVRAITAGARGYICKPFSTQQIKTRIVPLVMASLKHDMETSFAQTS